MFNLKNKTFLITGTTNGVGEYLATKLLELDCKVIGIGNSSRNYIKNKNFRFFKCDLSNVNDLSNLEKSLKKFKIDVLINNSGISLNQEVDDYFNKTININLNSHYKVTKIVKKQMKQNGKIIFISSIASKVALPKNPAYNASKAGLNLLAKSFALDFSKNKINVNTIILGYFKTRMTEKSFKNKKRYKQRLERTILKRWGKFSDILGPVIFLSTDASNYITGQEIVVDGGWTSKGL
jgi:NAD(P)-dependent dehydrogenase (short-subunit alcohol dehydrogenase family)